MTCQADDCFLGTEGQYCEIHRKRDLYLRRTYGMTLRDYYVILEFQGGRCYMCAKMPPLGENLTVDHDHISMRVRGLLCAYCNRRIVGRFRDWKVVARMAEYLKNPPALQALGEHRLAPKKKRKKSRRRTRLPRPVHN